jgi:hypothetical protein
MYSTESNPIPSIVTISTSLHFFNDLTLVHQISRFFLCHFLTGNLLYLNAIYSCMLSSYASFFPPLLSIRATSQHFRDHLVYEAKVQLVRDAAHKCWHQYHVNALYKCRPIFEEYVHMVSHRNRMVHKVKSEATPEDIKEWNDRQNTTSYPARVPIPVEYQD